ncbi:MAG: hypothetical protein ACREH8_02175 [Opitutaceae bacterium]
MSRRILLTLTLCLAASAAVAATPTTAASDWNIVDHIFQTFPYTDDPSVYAKLLDLGVMSFATDHPDVTLREIKAHYAARKSERTK